MSKIGDFDLTISLNHNGGWNDANHRVETHMFDSSLPNKIFERDHYTCRSCGLKGSKSDNFMEIHHIDGNHNNHSKGNLATFCPYCHMCFHIDYVGKERLGTLIFLPEISQIELFHLFRACKVYQNVVAKEAGSSNNSNNIEKVMSEVYGFLADRGKFMKTMFTTDSPAEFAGVMRQMIRNNSEDEKRLRDGLKHFRILPSIRYDSDTGENIYAAMANSWPDYYFNSYEKLKEIEKKIKHVPSITKFNDELKKNYKN